MDVLHMRHELRGTDCGVLAAWLAVGALELARAGLVSLIQNVELMHFPVVRHVGVEALELLRPPPPRSQALVALEVAARVGGHRDWLTRPSLAIVLEHSGLL